MMHSKHLALARSRALLLGQAGRLATAGFALLLSAGTAGAMDKNPAPLKAAAAATSDDAAKATHSKERYENLELLQRVLHFVETNYVDETKNQALIYGAIKGMLETLDPHSNFLTAELYRDMKVDTRGEFGGVGIEIGLKDGVLTVIAPIEDTPAWSHGLRPNDRIVKINRESTKGMNLVEAVAKMRGPKGTAITLSVYREGFDKIRDFSIMRANVKIQAVKAEELEPKLGYLRLTSFSESAGADMKKAIEKLQAHGKLRGLVLDLRSNPGGLLDQAVEVASLFYDDGPVVSTIGRNRDQKEIKYARKGNAFKDLPVAVLVNSSTASAAEIVAGALQDRRRAIIMGQPTFGKGSVQTVVDLGHDIGLKLTIARYYTPSGRSIQEKGVQPDVALEDFDPKLLAEARRRADPFRERDLKGHMINPDGADNAEDAVAASGTATKAAPAKGAEFSKDELASLAGDPATDGKGARDGARRTTGAREWREDDLQPQRVSPKEDYQVREAANYLKSYDVFRKIAEASGAAAQPEIGKTPARQTASSGGGSPNVQQ